MKQERYSAETIVHENSIVKLKFTAKWHDENGQHTAIQYIEKFNVWRDIDLLPKILTDSILHMPVGEGDFNEIKPEYIDSGWNANLQKTISLNNFKGYLSNGESVVPRTGRYYPKGWFSGVDGFFSDNMFPARAVKVDSENIVVDYNHPLASFEIKIKVDILDIFPPTDEHGGRCSDAIDLLLNNGPGMQLFNQQGSTDFITNESLERIDNDDDKFFYNKLRNVHHLDAYARDAVSKLYEDLINPGSRVLDLMASWESHMPDNLPNTILSGLGMNSEELRLNPLLNDYLVQDLNKEPVLTYKSDSYDAVICTASVEYLTDPLKIFSQVKRVLKPGGVFIVTFSNRWFPTKAVSIWSELHEFERVGLVMEYFKQSTWQGQINSMSSKGLHRPEDDPHYDKTKISDPVYAVWCVK